MSLKLTISELRMAVLELGTRETLRSERSWDLGAQIIAVRLQTSPKFSRNTFSQYSFMLEQLLIVLSTAVTLVPNVNFAIQNVYVDRYRNDDHGGVLTKGDGTRYCDMRGSGSDDFIVGNFSLKYNIADKH